jgi:hypothetical protein
LSIHTTTIVDIWLSQHPVFRYQQRHSRCFLPTLFCLSRLSPPLLQLYREVTGPATGALRRRHHHTPTTLRRLHPTLTILRRLHPTLTILRRLHPTPTILRKPLRTRIQLRRLPVLLVGQIYLEAMCTIDSIAEIVTKTSVYEKPTTYTTTKTVAIQARDTPQR